MAHLVYSQKKNFRKYSSGELVMYLGIEYTFLASQDAGLSPQHHNLTVTATKYNW